MNLNFICYVQLSVTIDVPGEDAYIFQPRLFGKVLHAPFVNNTQCLVFILNYIRISCYLIRMSSVPFVFGCLQTDSNFQVQI